MQLECGHYQAASSPVTHLNVDGSHDTRHVFYIIPSCLVTVFICSREDCSHYHLAVQSRKPIRGPFSRLLIAVPSKLSDLNRVLRSRYQTVLITVFHKSAENVFESILCIVTAVLHNLLSIIPVLRSLRSIPIIINPVPKISC